MDLCRLGGGYDKHFLNLIGRLRVSRLSVKHDRFRGYSIKAGFPMNLRCTVSYYAYCAVYSSFLLVH